MNQTINVVILQKSELEVSINEGTVKEKLDELENPDFYEDRGVC